MILSVFADGLLNMLSNILMHVPLRHPGMPKNAMQVPTPSGMLIVIGNAYTLFLMALLLL